MPDNIKLALPEGEYEFIPDQHLTFSMLDHVEGWFGEDLGASWPLQARFDLGAWDAVASVIWIVRRANGLTPNPEPKSREFDNVSVGKVTRVPNRLEGQESPVWTFYEDGAPVVLDMDEHLTIGRLKKIAKWFPSLDSYVRIHQRLIMGDHKAIRSGLWAAKDARGDEPNPVPRDMEDFNVLSVSPISNLESEDGPVPPRELEDEAVPLDRTLRDLGSSSTEAPRSSGESGDRSSDTSVTSLDET